MNMDRLANLHYAFQFGSDYAKTQDENVKAEFDSIFGQDEEAHDAFQDGCNWAKRKVSNPANK